MKLPGRNIFYGWFVVLGCAFVVFGVTGGQFSFGVFLMPMTEEFGWSRATLSLAFGVTFMISGLLRPVVGYLADRYSPKAAALTGVAVMGVMLLLMPLINSLLHLYLIFAVMSVGLALGTGPILTKVVSQWFYERRGLTLGLVSGAGSFGGMILVPSASAFLVLFSWQAAYLFLGMLLLLLVLPAGIWLIRNRPQDMGQLPQGRPPGTVAQDDPVVGEVRTMPQLDTTFSDALHSPLFLKLTFGYFV